MLAALKQSSNGLKLVRTASTSPILSKILVANRGEIACRVMRTAKRMGIRTVAVFSDADRNSMHVQEADEAVLIGTAPAADSYLRSERILEAARRTGAKAVHPGYGFLSENARFAQECAANNITFIGPPASAITAMGSKSESKHIMTAAKVPVVPGYHGEDQSDARLLAETKKMGFPVLIKPVMGGGGKGMKIVTQESEFLEALQSSQREAKSSFGDARVLIERYITAPRHIEVQVFADTHGNAVYLFERDCSVQRRHQKVLEEAPAPGMTLERRKQMGETAVNAARAVGYVGAGTVEFIADSSDGTFYFMEMNTRLQVEHPVTEMITGQDLVEWQIRVASGERLPKLQNDLTINGHALEARVYAENPEKGFLPSIGKLHHLKFPQGEGVRVDTGVRPGDEVKVFYDPMIAKLIVHGRDRPDALRRMSRALDGVEVAGVSTNVGFLRRAVSHPAFAAGGVTTGFIGQHTEELLPSSAPAVGSEAVALGAVALLVADADAAKATLGMSPWASLQGLRLVPLGDDGSRKILFKDHPAIVQYLDKSVVRITVGSDTWQASLSRNSDGRFSVENVNSGQVVHGSSVIVNELVTVLVDGSVVQTFHLPASALSRTADAGSGGVSAPMPGRITKVSCTPGNVTKGQTLMVMEAMKMEYAIKAPADGVVESLNYKEGDMVAEGAPLVKFQAKK